MTLELFTLCEYASNSKGKLTIVNTLDAIIAEKLPWRAYFGFALKGIIMHEHPANTKLFLSIIKQESDLTLFSTSFPVIDKTGQFAAAGNIRGLIFDREGEYIFRVSTSDGLCRDYNFIVKLANNIPNNDEH